MKRKNKKEKIKKIKKKGTYELCTQNLLKRKLKVCSYEKG